MLRSDLFGNPVTVASGDELAAVDAFIADFLAYRTGAAAVIAAADARPEAALLNTYAGVLCMLAETPDAAGLAGPYLQRAEAAAGGASPRELALVRLLRAWTVGDIPEVLSLADAILDEHPQDLLTAKFAHYHQFNRGDFPAMLRTALKVLPALGEVAEAHGMAAFAFEQCHLLAEAEREGRAALELRADEPWAQHALAHVMLTQGRIDEGQRFLEDLRGGWVGLNSFMVTHLWWHLALFYLSQGRGDDALAAYDEHCWAFEKAYSQDQIGAVSLLTQLELAGVGVGERWGELGDYLAGRAADTVQPFLTLQYLYGLARAGRPQADALVDAVRTAADAAPAHAREVWREVALPAAEGLLAHARGDHDLAARRLGHALPRLVEAGGSHAQRDLFAQIRLDAAIRSGRLVLAQQTLEERRAFDPDGAPLNRRLAEVYDVLGLPEQAAAARVRADARLARTAQLVGAS